jgi:hypothetical protein
MKPNTGKWFVRFDEKREVERPLFYSTHARLFSCSRKAIGILNNIFLKTENQAPEEKIYLTKNIENY